MEQIRKEETMKVKNLIKALQKQDPEATIVYSVDEEGNAYHPVDFAPVDGWYNRDEHDFSSEQFKGYVKAVCIN